MIDRGVMLIGLGSLAVLFAAFIITPAESAIPPTRAFSSVLTDAGTISATTYNSRLVAPKPPYAQISDLTTQACAAAGAASNVTLNTNDSIYKITHSVSSKTHEIIIQEAGIYIIATVPQIGEATVQANGVHNIWMMKNGAQVPNTNIKTTVLIQAEVAETVTGTLNWVGKLSKNDVIYFQQSCTDADIGIIFTAAGVPPSTPSVILTMAKINW